MILLLMYKKSRVKKLNIKSVTIKHITYVKLSNSPTFILISITAKIIPNITLNTTETIMPVFRAPVLYSCLAKFRSSLSPAFNYISLLNYYYHK